MNYINLAISTFALFAAIASAIAAWKSVTSAKTANTLAKEALTKRAQSELFLKVLLELARIHRLMTDFISNNNNDEDFNIVFDGRTVAELLPLFKELEALSPRFRDSFREDKSLADCLQRMSSRCYCASSDDLILIQKIIDLLQNSQRMELSNL